MSKSHYQKIEMDLHALDTLNDGSQFPVPQQQDLYPVDFGSGGLCSSSTEASTASPPTPVRLIDYSPTDAKFVWTPALEPRCSARPPPQQSCFDALPGRMSMVDPNLRVEPTFFSKARRREQNRIAQRAFRERKESHAKQLEDSVAELREEHRALRKKYEQLRDAHTRLQEGIKVLLQSNWIHLEDEQTDEKSPGSGGGG